VHLANDAKHYREEARIARDTFGVFLPPRRAEDQAIEQWLSNENTLKNTAAAIMEMLLICMATYVMSPQSVSLAMPAGSAACRFAP